MFDFCNGWQKLEKQTGCTEHLEEGGLATYVLEAVVLDIDRRWCSGKNEAALRRSTSNETGVVGE